MLSRRTITATLFAIVCLGLFVRLLHFWAIVGTAFPRLTFALTGMDMLSYWQWAHTILAGDWLGRNTFHPTPPLDIAPLEIWYRWWGGKAIFQQAPLYPYLLAVLLALFRDSVVGVFFVQLLLGGLQPLVLFALGRRLFDARVGLGAAALTALYGPIIFYEGALLRDWLPLLLEPLALLLLLRAQGTARSRDWVLAGGVLGVALLAKETILLFLPLALLWLWCGQRGTARKAIVASACLVGGVLAAMSPLVARNVIVGAPPFALSNRIADGIILGNAADGFPIGVYPPPSMKTILWQSGGRVLPILRETWKTYQGDWLRVARYQLLKLRALADPLEVPDNLSFSFGLEISPVLRFTLGYGLIFPLGVAGFLLVLPRWRAHSLLLLYGLSTLGSLMFSMILSRYRLSLVLVLILYGAAGAVRWSELIRTRRFTRGIAFGGLLLGLILVQQRFLAIPMLRDIPGIVLRPQEYIESAKIYASDGRLDLAVAEMERLRAKAQDNPKFGDVSTSASLLEGEYHALWAKRLLDGGNRQEARAQVEKAEILYATDPHVSIAHYRLGVLYYHLGDPVRARLHLMRFLELESQGERADEVRRLLARLEGASK